MQWVLKLFGIYLLWTGVGTIGIVILFWIECMFPDRNSDNPKTSKKIDWWLYVIMAGALFIGILIVGLAMGILKVERIRKGY